MCRATHSFLHICCGLLVPVFLSAWRWPAPVQPGSTAGAAAAGDDSSSPTKWRGLQAVAERAAAVATAQLRLAAGMSAAPALRALVWWYLLANVWLLCKLSAGL